MTVNKAILEFVDREYLSRIQGSGTFVSKMRKEGSRSKEMSFNDSLTQKGFKVKTIVLEQKRSVRLQRYRERPSSTATETRSQSGTKKSSRC